MIQVHYVDGPWEGMTRYEQDFHPLIFDDFTYHMHTFGIIITCAYEQMRIMVDIGSIEKDIYKIPIPKVVKAPNAFGEKLEGGRLDESWVKAYQKYIKPCSPFRSAELYGISPLFKFGRKLTLEERIKGRILCP